MNVLENSVPGTIFFWVFRSLRMQQSTEQELQMLPSRLLLWASWRFMSYDKFDGNISSIINFFGKFYISRILFHKYFKHCLHCLSNLPGRVCVITVKLIQDPACCKEKGMVSCMFYVKQNGKFSKAFHGKRVWYLYWKWKRENSKKWTPQGAGWGEEMGGKSLDPWGDCSGGKYKQKPML